MGVMHERVIDYPTSQADFQGGPPYTDLWVRPAIDAGPTDPPLSQLFDVISLDAHVLDATLRARSSPMLTTASLDLSVVWHQVLPFSAWRRVRTDSGNAEHGFVATTGIVRDEHGGVFAEATQRGRVRRED
jgi:acyl-CoA thioesterase